MHRSIFCVYDGFSWLRFWGNCQRNTISCSLEAKHNLFDFESYYCLYYCYFSTSARNSGKSTFPVCSVLNCLTWTSTTYPNRHSFESMSHGSLCVWTWACALVWQCVTITVIESNGNTNSFDTHDGHSLSVIFIDTHKCATQRTFSRNSANEHRSESLFLITSLS